MKLKIPALIFAPLILLSGCAIQKFDFVDGMTKNSPALDDSQTFWVGGIGQSTQIDAAKVCGGAANIVSIETQQTGGDVALTLITLTIYSPRHIRVTCK
jgi:hypothetical protein